MPERKDQLESDVYDAWSTSIGLFSSQQQLLGMVRMTPAPLPFMLESEFSGCLVGSHRVRKELDTAEITRLAVDPTITDRGLSAKLMRTIFKGMYHWTLANNIRYTYLVVGALLDLDEFRSTAASKRPEMLEWLHTTEPATTETVVRA